MEISAFYLQCSNFSSQKPWKCRKKTNLSLYTSRKKKKTQRKSSNNESNCSCSNSSTSESHLPWRISNFINENEHSRFSFHLNHFLLHFLWQHQHLHAKARDLKFLPQSLPL